MSEKKKLLIVEDDEMISCMYKTKFEADGFECVTYNTGAGVLEVAKENKPDIILLDIMLPQVDGFSILKELKSSTLKKIPVIMLTNLGTEEDKKKGEKLGAAGYLVKASLTPAQLSEKIKEYLK